MNEDRIRAIVKDELTKLVDDLVENKIAKLLEISQISSTAPDCSHCGSSETNWMRRNRKSGSYYYVVRCRECNRTTRKSKQVDN